MIGSRLTKDSVPYIVDIPKCRIYKNIDSPEALQMVDFENMQAAETLEIKQDLSQNDLPKAIALIPSKKLKKVQVYTNKLTSE